jgi:SAM-dependent methyltransferase
LTDAAGPEAAERAAADADWKRRSETLMAAAKAGEPDIAARLDLLVPPSGPAEVRRQLAGRVLVTLVNAGHYGLARRFADTQGLWALAVPAGSGQAPETLTAGEQDTLFCLAVLDVNDGGDCERALVNFRRLQRLLPPEHHLQRPSAEGEAVTLRRLGRAIQIAWPSAASPGKTLAMACPTCAGTAPKSEVCTVNAYFPGRDVVSRLLRCPECNCIFLETLHELAYHEDTDLRGDGLAFHVQQNAGIWPIARTVARVARPPGSRYIDVGCGFGFGLDFALHGLRWSGRGLDPSSLARRGAEQLNLPIEPRYFTPADATPPADVVMASEVLEHVAAPREFIAMLRQAVAPGGVLIVTTPNGEAVRPDVPSSVLVPVLSIGAHLVLQTAASLEWLLRDAGLAHVVVERNPVSLIAYASDRPFTLENDEARLRATYQSYLRARMASSPRGSDLWLGFAARAYQEAVIDCDTATADAAAAALADELRQRYRIDLDDPGTLPALSAGMSTGQLRNVAPFSIANLLYLRAVQRRQGGDQTARLGEIFLAAARSARVVRRVLAAMNADDPTIGFAEHDGAAQATLIAARRGGADTLERLAFALASPDGADQPPLRHLADATLAALLTAGAYRMAWRLRAEFPGSVGPNGRLCVWLPWALAGCARAARRALLRR